MFILPLQRIQPGSDARTDHSTDNDHKAASDIDKAGKQLKNTADQRGKDHNNKDFSRFSARRKNDGQNIP